MGYMMIRYCSEDIFVIGSQGKRLRGPPWDMKNTREPYQRGTLMHLKNLAFSAHDVSWPLVTSWEPPLWKRKQHQPLVAGGSGHSFCGNH